jgi:hypothetical protein
METGLKSYRAIPRPYWMAQMLSKHYFYLISLNKEPDEVLASHGPSGTMELLLKRGWELNFVEWLRAHSSLLKDISVSDMFSLYMGYALAVGKAEDIIEAFLAIYPQQKDTIMTAARQLERRGMKIGMERGMEKGIEKGIEKGRQEVARNMLVKLRLDLDTVQKATELNKEELQKILKEGSTISKGN